MNFSADLVDIFTAARGALVEAGRIPPPARDFFKNLQTSGNPYKQPKAERGQWTGGLTVPAYEDQEYLFYVGCLGSYDDKGKLIAQAVAQLLQRAGIDSPGAMFPLCLALTILISEISFRFYETPFLRLKRRFS